MPASPPVFDWDSPEDAERTWIWDAMHAARPLVPIQIEAEDGSRVSMGAREFHTKVVEGYLYRSELPIPEAAADRGRTGAAIWAEVEPLCREQAAAWLAEDHRGTSARDLLDRVMALHQEGEGVWSWTMRPIAALQGEMSALVEFCEQTVGADGARLAAELIVGGGDASSAAGATLGQLARESAEHPTVREAILGGAFDGLAETAEGTAFLARFETALAPYAWMASVWYDVRTPTWAQDPATPLRLIQRFLRAPAENPLAAQDRAGRRQQEATETMRAALPRDRHAELDRLTVATGDYQRIREERARYQLIAYGMQRRLFLALGAALRADDWLADPEDVLFLRVSQIEQLLDGAAIGLEQVLTQQHADYARWCETTPPPWLGAEPPHLDRVGLTGGPLVRETTAAGVISGLAASGGSATGPARVLHDIAEAPRVEPGDILVCRTTAPPWTPLFASVAAVVTDTGGVLCHTAIVAREYGLPCVVGTVDATRVIADGDQIHVDGDSGTVTIL
ncbi:MAG: PEP-utilizing enzyme [Chloroflexi bacterium]|nr:PEP-utilizing enzyme [Chloroflexota bacterium]